MNPCTTSASSPADGPAPSFKTNVNRAKTKRWVEAKSYTYDGDDWGEADDYDEYDGYNDPASNQKPTGLRQQGQSVTPSSAYASDARRDSAAQVQDSRQEQLSVGAQRDPTQSYHSDLRAVNVHPAAQSSERTRAHSFSRGEEGQAFSTAGPHMDIPPDPLSMHAPGVDNQPQYSNPPYRRGSPAGNVRGQSPQSPNQRQPQGVPFYQQPGQSRSKPSIDSQGRTGPPFAGPRGPAYGDLSRQPHEGSRSQSMTSTSPSIDNNSRREFPASAMPEPLRGGPVRGPPRKSSLSQQEAPYNTDAVPPQHENTFAAPNLEASPVSQASRDGSGSTSKALPFVRPADIYRRMQEEREKEKFSQGSLRPNPVTLPSNPRDVRPIQIGGRPDKESSPGPLRPQASFEPGDDTDPEQRTKLPLDSVPERKSEYGMNSYVNQVSSGGRGQITAIDTAGITRGKNGSPLLPDLSRMSGLGDSLLDSMRNRQDRSHEISETARETTPQHSAGHLSPQDAQTTPLQHQPSLGFRTVVAQAFDDQIPPTPSSTAGSAVVRSNSESTNGISPIISRASSGNNQETKPKQAELRGGKFSMIAEEPNAATPQLNSFAPADSFSPSLRKPSPSRPSLPKLATPTRASEAAVDARHADTAALESALAKPASMEANQPSARPENIDLAETNPTYKSGIASNNLPRDTSTSAISASQEREMYADQTLTSRKFDGTLNNSPDTGVQRNSDEDATSNKPAVTAERAESPSKGRVRDLADRFEVSGQNRRGSDSSQHSNSKPKSPEQSSPTRPIGNRVESFRPQIPGGWASYVSNAPLQPDSVQPDSGNGKLVGGESFGTSPSQSDTPGALEGERNTIALGESSDIVPKPTSTTEYKPNSAYEQPSNQISHDPFSAVAAAGTALAGALVAAVGLGRDDPASRESSISSEKENLGRLNAGQKSSESKQDATFRPEALKPSMIDFNDSSSSVGPTPLPKDTPVGSEYPNHPDYFAPVGPLKSKSRDHFPNTELPPLTRPSVLPTLSTEPSPADYESDRLRKELVRELSPNTERFSDNQGFGPKSPVAKDSRISTYRDSIGLPSEYESYWNGSDADDMSRRPSEQPEETVGTALPASSGTEPSTAISSKSPGDIGAPLSLPQKLSPSVAPDNKLQVRPGGLIHRFSWEPAPQETEEVHEESRSSHPNEQPESSPNHDEDLNNTFVQSGTPETPKAMQEAASPREDKELPPLQSASLMGDTGDTGDTDNEGRECADSPTLPSDGHVPLPPLPTEQPKIPAFREIIALKSPSERIEAFNATRKQFANMDSGLSNWIMTTAASSPEHAELLLNGGNFGTTGMLSSSAGGVSYSTRSPHPSPRVASNSISNSTGGPPAFAAAGGLGGKSTKIKTQQVQAKGKDLLHSAGIFGGKANVAAKGLFAKGKSRFRVSSSGEKAASRKASAASSVPLRGMSPSSQPQPHSDSPGSIAPSSINQTTQYSNLSHVNKSSTLPNLAIPNNATSRMVTPQSPHDLPFQSPSHVQWSPNGINATNEESVAPQIAPTTPKNDLHLIGSHGPRQLSADFTSSVQSPRLTLGPGMGTSFASQIPLLTDSSSRTPTQADFPKFLHDPYPPPVLPLLPSENKLTAFKQSSGNSPELDDFGRARHQETTNQELRASENPNEILHSVNNEAVDIGNSSPGVNPAHAGSALGSTGLNQTARNLPMQEFSSTRRASLATDGKVEQRPADRHSRPFSFISFGDMPTDELKFHHSLIGQVTKDPPRSPVSPERSASAHSEDSHHNEGRSKEDGPTHYGTDYDFISAGGQSSRDGRAEPSSGLANDPNLLEHPAFREGRHEDEEADVPSNYFPANVRREDTMLPRQQTTEYQLDGVGPPSAEDLSKGKPNSRRGSGIFRSIRPPSKDNIIPAVPYNMERESVGSPTSATSSKAHKRKSSLFRNLTSGKSGSFNSKEPSRISPARSRTNDHYDTKAGSSYGDTGSITAQAGSFRQVTPQRAATTNTPEKSKSKNRFSALGSLFGRGNAKKYTTPTPSPGSAFENRPAQPHSPQHFHSASVPQMSPSYGPRSASISQQSPSNMAQQQSSYYPRSVPLGQQSPANPVQYEQNSPMTQPSQQQDGPPSFQLPQIPPGYAIQPIEGFYGPNRKDGIFYPESGDPSRSQAVASSPQHPHEDQRTLSLSRPQNKAIDLLYGRNSPNRHEQNQYGRNNIIPLNAGGSSQYQLGSDRYGGSPQIQQNTFDQSQSQRVEALAAIDPNAARAKPVAKVAGYHEAPAPYVSPFDQHLPPLPPPKDGGGYLQTPDQQESKSRRSSYDGVSGHPPSPTPSNPKSTRSTRHSLPAIQTNLANPQIKAVQSAGLTPEERRKIRQMEIEGSGSSTVVPKTRRTAPVGEEVIIMSSSSYPGQEWQPHDGWSDY